MSVKRIYFLNNPTPLDEFAERYNLTIEVHERPLKVTQSTSYKIPRFYANLSEEGMLGEFSNGNTPEAAMKDLARLLSGRTIMINPYSCLKKEIKVPDLNKKQNL